MLLNTTWFYGGKRLNYEEHWASRQCVTSSICHCTWPRSSYGGKGMIGMMRAYAILHNMIVDDERDSIWLWQCGEYCPESIINHDYHSCYKTYFQRSKEVHDPLTHMQLFKRSWLRKYGSGIRDGSRDDSWIILNL